MIVHLPCGVGGAPGGICWGLAQVFGLERFRESVHVFFAEPVAAPCCVLALGSGRGGEVSVADIGLDGRTEADGLAVGRASQVVCDMVADLVAGGYTVTDAELFEFLRLLVGTEGKEAFIEPSSCASLAGVRRMREGGLRDLCEKGVHVFWATGGSLVPEEERRELMGKFFSLQLPR